MPSHLFLDIETIPSITQPDPTTIKAPANYKDKDKIAAYQAESVEAEWRKEALKSHKGRVLVIGWAIDDGPVQSVQHDGSDEEGMILDFWTRLRAELGQTQRPSIVGFNCRSFDCNWLRHRAYKYRIPAMAAFFPWERYAKNVVDLREQWLGADYRGEGTLDDLAKFLGIEGKTAGMDGSQVFDYWQAGRVNEVAEYCRRDVELTRNLWAMMHYDEARFLFNGKAA